MEDYSNKKKFFFDIPDEALSADSSQALINFFEDEVDKKDHYTKCHCNRVSEYCVLIGKKLGLPQEDLDKLRIGGLFHDIGKIGIPDNILKKESKLTNEEYDEIQTHTSLGVDILTRNKVFKEIIPIVEYHHEKYDGNGYPFKLKGDEIPMEARVVGVADIFSALVEKRVYKDKFCKEQVVSILSELSKNNKIDSAIVNVVIENYDYLVQQMEENAEELNMGVMKFVSTYENLERMLQSI